LYAVEVWWVISNGGIKSVNVNMSNEHTDYKLYHRKPKVFSALLDSR